MCTGLASLLAGSCLTTCLAAWVVNSTEFSAEFDANMSLWMREIGKQPHHSRTVWAKPHFLSLTTLSSLRSSGVPASSLSTAVSEWKNHTYTLRDFSYEDIQVSTKSTICFCFNSGYWSLKEERYEVCNKRDAENNIICKESFNMILKANLYWLVDSHNLR